jgi:hypothetical protein
VTAAGSHEASRDERRAPTSDRGDPTAGHALSARRLAGAIVLQAIHRGESKHACNATGMDDADFRRFRASLAHVLAEHNGKQEAAARYLDVDPATVYRWLADDARPRRRTLREIGPKLDEAERRATARHLAREVLARDEDPEGGDDNLG